jgi:hypothetical protein
MASINSSSVAAGPRNEIATHHARVDQHLNNTREMLADLRDRLSGVVQPEPTIAPGDTARTAETPPPGTPMGMALSQTGDTVVALNMQLRSLLNRLEL